MSKQKNLKVLKTHYGISLCLLIWAVFLSACLEGTETTAFLPRLKKPRMFCQLQ